MAERPSMLKATLIGGALAGLLSAIPVLNLVNCACCALIIGGGVLASFLYSKECGKLGLEFRPGRGALVGFVAGIFCALVSSVLGRLFGGMSVEQQQQIIEQLEQAEIPPETMDTIVRFLEMSGGFLGMLISFLVMLVLASVFSTIGGLIGGSAFKREALATGAASSTPPPSSPAPPPPPAP